MFIVGTKEGGVLEMGTTFDNYESVHTILNRALFELNMAHAKAIRENVMNKETVNG